MIVIASAGICCLLALIALNGRMFGGRVELVEEADGLELNAYLSSSQVQEFKDLRDKQANMNALIDRLEKSVEHMQPEDTKVKPSILSSTSFGMTGDNKCPSFR